VTANDIAVNNPAATLTSDCTGRSRCGECIQQWEIGFNVEVVCPDDVSFHATFAIENDEDPNDKKQLGMEIVVSQDAACGNVFEDKTITIKAIMNIYQDGTYAAILTGGIYHGQRTFWLTTLETYVQIHESVLLWASIRGPRIGEVFLEGDSTPNPVDEVFKRDIEYNSVKQTYRITQNFKMISKYFDLGDTITIALRVRVIYANGRRELLELEKRFEHNSRRELQSGVQDVSGSGSVVVLGARQEHVGCYADEPWNGRTLSYFHNDREIGLEACGEVCRSRGDMFMGYEFASQCFCGAADEDFTRHGTADACKNGLGGRLAIDVYKVLDDPPVDGKFGQWGPCSTSCGEDGNRVRLCDSPAPQYGGADCVGSASDNCLGNDPCPIAVHGSWGEWESCSETCGSLGLRIRLCDSPAAENGGVDCVGMGVDECPENNPCRQEHVGCFADEPWNGRTLSYFHEKREIGLEACGEVCRKRGSMLMGYEFASECFCGAAGEDYSRYGVADSCKNGRGGHLSLNVYRVL